MTKTTMTKTTQYRKVRRILRKYVRISRRTGHHADADRMLQIMSRHIGR